MKYKIKKQKPKHIEKYISEISIKQGYLLKNNEVYYRFYRFAVAEYVDRKVRYLVRKHFRADDKGLEKARSYKKKWLKRNKKKGGV